jgi:hypothetical protein
MDRGSISGRGKRFSIQRADWQGREADDSPPSVPKLRMRGAVPLLPPSSSWLGDK